MATRTEICRMDAVALAGHTRARRISPVDVVDAVLERMERVEPHIHAFCTPAPELARAEARRIEAEIMARRDPGAEQFLVLSDPEIQKNGTVARVARA